MLERSFYAFSDSQRGAVATVISVILLITVTLLTFVANRAGLFEIKLAANEVRTAQAFSEAQSRFDFAFYSYQSSRDTTTFNAGNSNVKFCSPNLANALKPSCSQIKDGGVTCASYDPYETGVPSGVDLDAPMIVACGWSDDGVARHIVMQQVKGSPAIPGTPANVFTTRSSVGSMGSFTVLNYFNNITYWSGGDIESGSATAKGFVRHPVTATVPTIPGTFTGPTDAYVLSNSLDCNSAPVKTGIEYTYSSGCNIPTTSSTDQYLKSTEKNASTTILGSDIIDKDVSLSSLSNDDFFRQFFGELGPTDYKAQMPAANVLSNPDLTKLNDLRGQTVWVDGNYTLPSGTIGTITNPVTLIVNGNLTISSSSTFYGMIYVAGTLTGNGGPTIYGAMVVRDGSNVTGNGSVIYDPAVLDRARSAGTPGLVSGSWRDWNLP